MRVHCASRTSFPTIAVACAPKAVNEVGRPCEVQGGELVARFELVQQMRTSRPELIIFCAFHNAKLQARVACARPRCEWTPPHDAGLAPGVRPHSPPRSPL
jgi:hypothetical protein